MSKKSKQDKDEQPSGQRQGTAGEKGGDDSNKFNLCATMRKVKCFWQTHGGLSVIASIFLIVAVILFGIPLLLMVFSWFDFPSSEIILRVVLLIFSVILVSSIIVFTKPLPDFDNKKDENDKKTNECLDDALLYLRLKRQWMVLSYSFMIFSLVAAVLPFTLDFMPDPEDGPEYREYINKTIDKPITIFLGCVLNKNSKTNALSCYPTSEVEPPVLSWVIHIGGNLTALTPYSKYKVEDLEDIKNDISEMMAKLSEQKIAEENARISYEETRKEFEMLSKGSEDVAAIESVKIKLKNKKAELVEANKVVKDTQRDIGYLRPFLQGNAGFGVTGGLVVPFYLIVLSMVGAAISLTRRIPEYQKQAVKGYVGTKDAPYLPPRKLREYLVFQILQFISAPFLAVVAYFAIEPSTTTATVALAFAAGFSSETVLLWIRGVVDKVRPEVAPEVQTGSVVGSIPEMKGKKAAVIEKEVSISIVGLHELRAAFADDGQFVIERVPGGEWALEVARYKKDKSVKEIVFRKITVLADKAVPVLVEFTVA